MGGRGGQGVHSRSPLPFPPPRPEWHCPNAPEQTLGLCSPGPWGGGFRLPPSPSLAHKPARQVGAQPPAPSSQRPEAPAFPRPAGTVPDAPQTDRPVGGFESPGRSRGESRSQPARDRGTGSPQEPVAAPPNQVAPQPAVPAGVNHPLGGEGRKGGTGRLGRLSPGFLQQSGWGLGSAGEGSGCPLS